MRAEEVVEHFRIGFVHVSQLREVRLRIEERVQRVVRIEVVRVQILMIRDERTVRAVELAVFRLIFWHRVGRRTVIGDDVEDNLDALFRHAGGKGTEIDIGRDQMLVLNEEIHAPVAVIAGLAPIRTKAFAGANPAGERLVRIVDNRRDPQRGEAHL